MMMMVMMMMMMMMMMMVMMMMMNLYFYSAISTNKPIALIKVTRMYENYIIINIC